jgi:hypothetical protein
MSKRITAPVLALMLGGLVACGGNDEAAAVPGASAETAPAAEPAAPAEAPAATPAAPADAALTLADIDAYVVGMRKEIELLKAGGEKVRQARAAKDQEAEMKAMLDLSMGDRDAQVAQAAGMAPARWQAVKSKIAAVVGGAAMRESMASMGGDTSGMAPDQRAAHEANLAKMLAEMPDPYAGLEPAVAEALKARHAELGKLHGEAVGLLMNAAS